MKITFASPEALENWIKSQCTICGEVMRADYQPPLLDEVTLFAISGSKLGCAVGNLVTHLENKIQAREKAVIV